MYDTAIRLGELQAEFKLQIDPQEYAQENLKFGLVEVVYEWAKVLLLENACITRDVFRNLESVLHLFLFFSFLFLIVAGHSICGNM